MLEVKFDISHLLVERNFGQYFHCSQVRVMAGGCRVPLLAASLMHHVFMKHDTAQQQENLPSRWEEKFVSSIKEKFLPLAHLFPICV